MYKEGKKEAVKAYDNKRHNNYELASMQSKCVKEQNKYFKNQSAHGMPAQGGKGSYK